MSQKILKQKLLDDLYKNYEASKKLFIEGGSQKIIFGEGNPDSNVIFIGEAPGAQEDLEGRPFVGRSGKLLNQLFSAAKTQREDVFITNIVKCRPPNNRKPFPHEIANARELLLKQIDIINPTIICTLGASALQGVIDRPLQISQIRGQLFFYNNLIIMPTYHPAFILRNPQKFEALAKDINQACTTVRDLAAKPINI